MTPERLKELLAFYHAGIGGFHYVNTGSMLTVDELRALLAIVQRAGETCEWTEEGYGAMRTSCGKKVMMAFHSDETRPCWCGRTVAVRDGRTT